MAIGVSHCLKEQNKGFTLVELLVVILVLGVLFAIALPNLLGQVGKARDSEMKNAVGVIGRGQQAYHAQNQKFAGGTEPEVLVKLGIDLEKKYLESIGDLLTADGPGPAYATTTNTNSANDGTRAYSGAVGHNAGAFTQVICQSAAQADDIPAPTAVGISFACPDDSEEIK